MVSLYDGSSLWAWNGTDWLETPIPSGPRVGAGMACDRARQRFVMHGGLEVHPNRSPAVRFNFGPPVYLQLAFADGVGSSHQTLAVPYSPVFRGLTLVAQGAVLDPAAIQGVAFTPGLRMVIGD